jgi:hypothetical protein
MNDAIREALALATAEADEWMRDAAGRRCLPRADQVERMTAAICARLLRGLPRYHIRATGLVMTGEDCRELAAAVEQAAQAREGEG